MSLHSTKAMAVFQKSILLVKWLKDTSNEVNMKKNFDIRDFGAGTGLEAHANQTAIQKAIDTASAEGARVVVPAGKWNCGTLRMKSHVELHLDEGAVIFGSARQADYNADDEFPENFWSVGEEWSGGHLILGYKVEDVALTGAGVFDGNGGAFFGEPEFDSWFPGYKYGLKLHPVDREWFRPGPMVAFFLSKDIRMEGVTFANTPCWTCHIRCCDGFSAESVTIDADRTIANSDGFSIDCTRNVRIEKCTVKTGDDGFAIRASCHHHAAAHPCENIVVRDCDIWSCCFGVRFGVGTGTIRNALFENCRFHESAHGVGYTPAWVAEGKNVYIEDTTFRNCFFGQCCSAIGIWMPEADALVRNVRFEDCAFESAFPLSVGGNSKGGRVEDIEFVRCSRKTLDHITVRESLGWFKENRKSIRQQAEIFAQISPDAKNVVVRDCTPEPSKPSGVLVLSFDDSHFDNWKAALPVFDKYGAHATFFANGKTNNDIVRAMKILRAHGHSIGLHGQNHANAPELVAEKGWDAYYTAEVATPRRQCGVSYVPVSSFAYPNGRRTDETDAKFYEAGFERLRGCSKLRPYDPSGEKRGELKPLVTNDAAFFPALELPRRKRLDAILLGEAYNTDIDEIVACVKRAGERKEVFVIASHDISPDAKGINMKTEWLGKILAAAKESGVRVLGFDELPFPE